jgi:hypothetical protein
MIFKGPRSARLKQPFMRLAFMAPLLASNVAVAATIVATPGEQNTASGENGCATEPCQNGHWLHYPELLQKSLGAGYTVMNNGDGGAVLGCDAATMTVAGGSSFCKSGKYTASIAGPPNIAIIGPFGEHDQRIIAGANEAMYGNQATFEGAYEGMVQKYLALNAKVYLMTPIDVPWGGTPNLQSGKNIVKDFMLPAARKVAQAHNLKVIDTYEAMTSTQQLVTTYYATDGQVNAAGQQKMAELILAALNDNSTGGAGGSGAGGAAGAAGAGGSGGIGGGTGGTGGVATGGAAGASAGGAAGGSAPVAGTTSGGAASGGGGAGPIGQGGSTNAAGTSTTTPSSSSSESSGCALSGSRGSSWGTGAALLGIALALWTRKRRS